MTGRVGILDWGIGGVGILRALRQRTRNVPVLYLSDSGHTPYGLLTSDALARRVARLLGFLVERGASSVIVACNAASTVLDSSALRGFANVPVTGVIAPAIALVSPRFCGTLGVLGGARTIRSGLYRRALSGAGRRIVQRIAQPLSAHVEAGSTGSRHCADDLDRILAPLGGAQAVLLACTHYPAIAELIAARVPQARLLDPAEAVIDHVLTTFPLPAQRVPDLVLTTGDARRTRRAAQRAWGLDPGPCHFERIT
jgi:glutamate racemase